MAYGLKYSLSFKNTQGDLYRVEILEKDFTDIVTKLKGAKEPFTLKYKSGDDSIINSIRASEALINFYSEENISLANFYSEEDDHFRVDFYCERANGTKLDKLLWRGFVMQDTSEEDFLDPPYVIQLNATDGIALLKNIKFDEAVIDNYITKKPATVEVIGLNGTIRGIAEKPFSAGDSINIDGTDFAMNSVLFFPDDRRIDIEFYVAPGDGDHVIIYESNLLIQKITLLDYIRIALKTTEVDLPVRIFSNIFENTQQDRGDLATAEMFSETRLFNGMFVDDQRVWKDFYYILETILTPINATIIQADGYWNIIRFGEAYLFADNAITGTQYDSDFTNPQAVTLDTNFTIQHATDYEMIGADAKLRIERPFKYVKETFNYVQPKELIFGLDLRTLGAFIDTETIGDLRYDRYQVNDTWKHENSDPNGFMNDTSYIEVVTDIPTETEIERYIVSENTTDEYKWLQLTPIEVSANDFFDFQYKVKARAHTADAITRVATRFILFVPDGHYYVMTTVPGTLVWTGPFIFSYKVNIGHNLDIPSLEDTEYHDFLLQSYVAEGKKLPVFPVDGILIVGLDGSNNTLNNGSVTKEDVFMKDFKLTFYNKINESLFVIGQTHTTDQPEIIKSNYDEEIFIDDSPRNTIAGTLYTNDLTTFTENIGDIYFTKTLWWHRLQNEESLRLGEIATFERKLISSIPRTLIEGKVTGIRYAENKFINALSFLQIDSMPGLQFIFGICEFNYMDAVFNGTMRELYKDGETDDNVNSTYDFEYIYKTT